jgi:uncharacterized protein
MTFMLENGPENADHELIIAHGAGAGITFYFLEEIAKSIARHGIKVTRIEFAYMTGRANGRKGFPPKAERLAAEYVDMVAALTSRKPKNRKLLIGGKSLGGRVASLIADDQFRAGNITGLVCLGYPFHPPGQPGKLRTAHLENLACPALIVQGTRDPFGTQAEISAMTLSPEIAFQWISDGDHDFAPRAKSGFTQGDNLEAAADAVAQFVRTRC